MNSVNLLNTFLTIVPYGLVIFISWLVFALIKMHTVKKIISFKHLLEDTISNYKLNTAVPIQHSSSDVRTMSLFSSNYNKEDFAKVLFKNDGLEIEYFNIFSEDPSEGTYNKSISRSLFANKEYESFLGEIKKLEKKILSEDANSQVFA